MYPLDDTIVAVATPPGGAARGILRLSGPKAVECAARLFRSGDSRPLSAASARSVVAGALHLPELHSPMPCDAYVWTVRVSPLPLGEGPGVRAMRATTIAN